MTSLVFRLCENAPVILREVCLERGWEEFDEESEEEEEWNLWWKSSGFRTSDFQACRPWQRLNHFPKSNAITRKDCLARNLRRMKSVYGRSVYDFVPLSFNLPNDYRKLVAEYSKQKEPGSGRQLSWICKPTDQSRGKGIFIFRDLTDLTYDCAMVVQKYIPNPLLIAGYKFDLRLYVLVTSFHPLHIYTYQEGLVRFGTEKFDLNTLDNVFSHLTNTSINKKSPSYFTDKERIGHGCKWSLGQLRTYFHQLSIDDRLLWHRINALIILTLITQVPEVHNHSTNCFELFGFDVLIDANLKPWLLEVNFSPSLGVDCTLDLTIKKPLLHDTLDIINLKESDIISMNNYITKCDAPPPHTSRYVLPKACQLQGNSRKSSLLHTRTIYRRFRDNVETVNTSSDDTESEESCNCDGGTKNCVLLPGNNGSDDSSASLTAEDYNKEAMKVERTMYANPRKMSNGIKSTPIFDASYETCTAPCKAKSQCCGLQANASFEFQKAISCFGKNILHSSAKATVSASNSRWAKRKKDLPDEGAPNKQSYLQQKISSISSPESSIVWEDKSYKRSLTNLSLCSSKYSLPPVKKSFGRNHFIPLKRSLKLTPGRPSRKPDLLKSQNQRNLAVIKWNDRNKHPTNEFSKMKLCNRVGDYVLVFPFNKATRELNLSKQLNVKEVIEEVKKTLKKMTEIIRTTPKSKSLGNEQKANLLDLNQPYWGFNSVLNFSDN